MAVILGDQISGNPDDRILDLDGSDLIYGGEGNDEILGLQFSGEGANSIFGGAGDDIIDFTLSFSDGDWIEGGTGDDSLSGSIFGSDRLVFNFAFETSPGGPAAVTRDFFEDTGTRDKTDWTQGELSSTYSNWLLEHFGEAAVEAWHQNDLANPLHLGDATNGITKVSVATGARTKDRWIADTVTIEDGPDSGSGSATLVGHDGNDEIFGFGTGPADSIVLKGFGAFDTDAQDNVQLDAAGLALLSTIFSFQSGELGAENSGTDMRLSWTGGSITVVDVDTRDVTVATDLAGFLGSGYVELWA